MRLQMVGLDPKRRFIRGDGIIEAAESSERGRAIGLGDGKIRPCEKGRLIATQRVAQSLEAL